MLARMVLPQYTHPAVQDEMLCYNVAEIPTEFVLVIDKNGAGRGYDARYIL